MLRKSNLINIYRSNTTRFPLSNKLLIVVFNGHDWITSLPKRCCLKLALTRCKVSKTAFE